jgi:NADH:ubiquinone oxidoreductase subunit 3 (subunit A)
MTDLQFRFYAFSIMFIIFDLVAIGFTYSIIKQLYYESFP